MDPLPQTHLLDTSSARALPDHGTTRAQRIRALVGSGDKIMGLTLPFVLAGLAFNLRDPALFSVAGPPPALKLIASVGLLCGLIGWLWSAVLIALRVPRGELITTGPYRWVKHPLYTSVALLVLPSVGLLLDSWLGVAIGLVLYIASTILSPAEESQLSRRFGKAWEAYCARVILPWL